MRTLERRVRGVEDRPEEHEHVGAALGGGAGPDGTLEESADRHLPLHLKCAGHSRPGMSGPDVHVTGSVCGAVG